MLPSFTLPHYALPYSGYLFLAMAVVSNLSSCLMWETERPNYCASRQSPYFSLFGEEWYLELSGNGYQSYNCLRLRNRAKNIVNDTSVTFHIIEGSRVISSPVKTLHSEPMFEFQVEHIYASTITNRWKICVTLTNNETNLVPIGTSSAASPQSVRNCAEIPPDLQQLSDDFCRMLDKEIIPDATLTCGGRNWKVHRSVLTARSEVFAGMFRSGMAESETGAVIVEDLQAAVLDVLLRYLYSGKVPKLSPENTPELYEASDRYALLGLRKACSDWMAGKLSLKNCLCYLVLADAHGDDPLKEAAVDFLTKHFAQIEKADWADFRKKHPFLALEVLERFAPSTKN